MFRIGLLTLLLTVSAFAAEVSVTVTIPNEYVPVLKAYLESQHPNADSNGDGSVSNSEGLAFITSRFQEVMNSIAVLATQWAETEQEDLLPTTYQNALANKRSAEAVIASERNKLNSR